MRKWWIDISVLCVWPVASFFPLADSKKVRTRLFILKFAVTYFKNCQEISLDIIFNLKFLLWWVRTCRCVCALLHVVVFGTLWNFPVHTWTIIMTVFKIKQSWLLSELKVASLWSLIVTPMLAFQQLVNHLEGPPKSQVLIKPFCQGLERFAPIMFDNGYNIEGKLRHLMSLTEWF